MLNVFVYHKPTEEEIERIEAIRKAYFALLQELHNLTREGSVSGRYVALAKTALEESSHWAVKSIVFERENQPK